MTTKQQKITKTISSDPPKVRDYNTLIFSDVLCPICRSIMIEPVSLPCNHNFCLCCFDDTMKTANRVCPLCQVRVGSWWRKAQINGKHINVKFQKAINERYSQQILNKLTGIEEDFKEFKMVKENGIQKKSLTGIEEDFKEPKMVEENGIQKKSDHVEIVEDIADSVSVKGEINDQEAFKREKLLFNEQVGEIQTAEILLAPPPSMKDRKTVENHEITTSPMVEPKIESSGSFSNKQFICRIFPLDKKNRYKRTDFYSPLSISALEIKTREQLRKKKEREDYQKGLEAEKLRLKELYDKSPASKTLFSWPPPKIPLRKSTDEFQQREAEYSEPKFNFATKLYSSRELILNRNVNGENMGEASATIRPKIRPIEKIVEIKTGKQGGKLKKNRYSNKPIDHRMNLSSQGNSRIKIKMFPKKTNRKSASKMLSSESTKFSSTSSSKNQFSLKRSISEENSDCSFHGFDNISVEDEQKVIKKFEDNFSSNGLFYGFYNNSSVETKRITMANCKREENEFEKKPSQEELDLEFARTLQKNLDRAYNTRPSKTLRIYT